MAAGKEENRPEEILTLLQTFLRKEHKLTDDEMERIREAKSFPLCGQRHLQRKVPIIALLYVPCEIRGGSIPDALTLESCFRDKADLLSFSVKSVKALHNVLTRLKCKSKFLSKAVKETVKPSGFEVRFKEKEKDLKMRLNYIIE